MSDDRKTYRQPRQEIASTGKQPSRFLPTGPAEEIHDLIDGFFSQQEQTAPGIPGLVEVKQEPTDAGIVAVGDTWHGVKCVAQNADGSYGYELACGVEGCDNLIRWEQWGDIATFLYSRNWHPNAVDRDGEPAGDGWRCPGHHWTATRKKG